MDDLGGDNIMNGYYTHEIANYSAHDYEHIQVVYGLAGPPTPAILVNPTSGLTTSESGVTAQFTVVLNTQPTADVTLNVFSSDTTEGVANVTQLVFTPTDWNTPKTVTITGVDDTVRDGNVGYSIVLGPASSTDPDYNGLDPTDVSAVNQDNEKGKGGRKTASSNTSVRFRGPDRPKSFWFNLSQSKNTSQSHAPAPQVSTGDQTADQHDVIDLLEWVGKRKLKLL